MATRSVPMRPRRGLRGVVATAAYLDSASEAANVAAAIRARLDAGARPKDHAVIYRTRATSRACEEALTRARVPYRVVGGAPFYDRPDARNLLAYLKVAAGVATCDDMKRTLQAPFRFLSRDFTRRLEARAAAALAAGSAPRWSLLLPEVAAELPDATARKRTQTVCATHIALLGDLVAQAQGGARPATLLAQVVERTKYQAWVTREEGVGTAESDRIADVVELTRAAEGFQTLGALLEHVREATAASKAANDAGKDENREDRVTLTTAHACVHPDTLVETPIGLQRISEIAASGEIAAPGGPKPYTAKFHLPQGRALRITTRSGYTLTVTPDHGLTSWFDDSHARVRADQLRAGDWLRLRLGCTCDAEEEPSLPPAPAGDIRAKRIATPTTLTEEAAEFLGLVVADGTVYRSGLRLIKGYRSVVDRFARLGEKLFGIVAHCMACPDKNADMAEFNSTVLSKWLLTSLDGMAPRNKFVPTVVMRAPLRVQAAFIRGLFEDGTVNEKDGHVDHIHWDNKTFAVVSTVQTMLLRFGIVSAVANRGHVSTLYIYGQNAALFRDRIGFVAPEKNARLTGSFATERKHSVPLSLAERRALKPWMNQWAWQNSNYRGHLSRTVVQDLIARSATTNPDLLDRLQWQYERIRKIEEVQCPSMCVEVPDGSRFLQNGFDGWNSKGLEWDSVFLIGCNEGLLPHGRADREEERRLFYVAVTRARDELRISWTTSRNSRPSSFLRDLGMDSETSTTALADGDDHDPVPDDEPVYDGAHDDACDGVF